MHPMQKKTSSVGRNKPVRATARTGVSTQPNKPETPPRATLGRSYSGLLSYGCSDIETFYMAKMGART